MTSGIIAATALILGAGLIVWVVVFASEMLRHVATISESLRRIADKENPNADS